MRTTTLRLTVLAAAFFWISEALAAPAGEERQKRKEGEELAKHLAFMEELERQAEAAGEKRFVPPPPPEPLTRWQEKHYAGLARAWAERLWATNGCYFTAPRTNVWTVPLSWVYNDTWLNMVQRSTLRVYPEPINESQPWRQHIVAEFIGTTVSGQQWRCVFNFFDRQSNKIVHLRNNLYSSPNVPRGKDHKPMHATEKQARLKAAEYASKMGLPDLWDKDKHMVRSFGFFNGVWEFTFTPNINGHSSLYAIIVHVADLPGLPLCWWHNDTDQIPANLPTNVVLTAEQARRKGEEYLKKYFPLKNLIPVVTFCTNYLEYASPNYNYIRPADDTGFSDYKPAKDEVFLVWKNVFKKPEGTGFPWIETHVDAATGEMLGGSD